MTSLLVAVICFTSGVVMFVIGAAAADIRRRWRARYVDTTRRFPKALKDAGIARAGGRCEHKHPMWFRCSSTGPLHADHIIPWSKGEETSWDNLQILCAKHNRAKSAWIYSPLYRWRLTARRKKYRHPRLTPRSAQCPRPLRLASSSNAGDSRSCVSSAWPSRRPALSGLSDYKNGNATTTDSAPKNSVFAVD